MKQILILILVAMYFLPIQAEAKVPYNSDFCDLVWSTTFFGQVDGEFKECKSRFKYQVNKMNSYFNHH